MEEPVSECSICLQPYEDALVIPRVLSCGHSLCECCISSFAPSDEGRRRQSFLRCPECNQRSKLEDLPKNIELLRLIRRPDSVLPPTRQAAPSIRPQWYRGKGSSFVYEVSIAELCRWIMPPRSAEIIHPNAGRVYLCRGEDMETAYPATFVCVQEAWKESKMPLGWDYRQKVQTSLERLSGHEIKDLLHLLKAQEEVFGIWMDAEGGPLYLVYKALGQCEQRPSGALMEVGTSSLSHICVNRGIELCEIFMGLHKERVVAGVVTPCSLGESEFMHLRLNVGAFLDTRKSFPFPLSTTNECAGLKFTARDDSSQSSDSFPFFYASPELMHLLRSSATLSKSKISCKTDSWTFACLFCKFCLGGTPWDEYELETFLEISLHGMQHAHSWIKCHVELDTLEPLTSISEVLGTIIKCFSHAPDERPCISEIWHLLSCIQTSPSSSEGSVACCNAGIGASAALWCLALGCNMYAVRRDVTPEEQDSSTLSADLPCIESLQQRHRSSEEGLPELQKTGSLEGHQSDVTCLAVYGQYLVSASMDRMIYVWSLKDNSPIKIIKGHSQKVMALVCDQQLSIFVSGDYGGELFTWGWDVETNEVSLLNRWHHHQDWRYSGVASVAISADSFLYSGAGDKTIKVWSLQDYGLLETLEGHKGLVSALLIDGEILFSGSWDGTVRLWWRSDHSPLAVLNDSIELGAVLALTISADLLLIGYQSGRIQVWKDEVCMNTISAHDNAISSLCLYEDRLYSGSWDGSVKVWYVDEMLDKAVPNTVVTCGSTIKVMACFNERLFVGLTNKIISYFS